MDLQERIGALSEAAVYDLASATDLVPSTSPVQGPERQVFRATRRCGGKTALLKVLQSNVCERDCGYCALRRGRDTRRSSLSPDELARSFDEMRRRRLVEGLFLSSSVCGSVARATDRMLATVEILRHRYAYDGYVHLKILPGADEASIAASMALAQRVSVNLEAPSAARLATLSHTKDYAAELWGTLRAVSRLRARASGTVASGTVASGTVASGTVAGDLAAGGRVSITTQLVVGPAGEHDAEILSISSRLYRELGLARVYYSAFRPIRHTPLEDHAPTPLWRQNRLYQADRLLAEYGFSPGELAFDAEGMLSRQLDPKRAWAERHPERFPVEVNRAGREELLRVPGIGPTAAERLLRLRRIGRVTTLEQLHHAGARASHAAPYILLDGRRPPQQLTLPIVSA